MAEQRGKNDPQGLLEAVEKYAWERHSTITLSSIQLSDPDDKERLVTDKDGYVLLDVEDVKIEEKDQDDYYASATIVFRVSQGEPLDTDPDTYRCYQLDDGSWEIEWHSC